MGISDGDTITVLDSDKKQHKIRLSGINAPEKGQAYGERSRQPLDCPRCGKTLELGLAQISVGLAWWYRRYEPAHRFGIVVWPRPPGTHL
ncbi:MAG TPA: hypothetical protein VLD36_04545 [Burkholderiales bacterium]|nr:hypothetical protein [Burkholderiales bacterium]